MSNTGNAAQRATKKAARLQWLRDRPDVLAQLAGANEDVEDAQSIALGVVMADMKAAGLYAKTSEVRACRWGIRLLVSELRGQAVGGKDQRYKS